MTEEERDTGREETVANVASEVESSEASSAPATSNGHTLEANGAPALDATPDAAAPEGAVNGAPTRARGKRGARAQSRDEQRDKQDEAAAGDDAGQDAQRDAKTVENTMQHTADKADKAAEKTADKSTDKATEERSLERGKLRFRGRDGRAESRGGRAEARGGRGRARRGEGRGGNEEESENGNGRGRSGFDLTALEEMNLTELKAIAKELEVPAATSLKKSDLVFRILEAQAESSGNQFRQGNLEILSDGRGFLRTNGYLPGDGDVYVSQSQIKRFNLRTGDFVSGQVRAPKDMERYYGLLRVEAINGASPEEMRQRKEFEKLTPIFPNEKFTLETDQSNITARIIDLIVPLGKGQRGLIVAPPKAGKTTLIKNIANSIALNHPEVVLIVLLIDERPEEVTDISRSVKGEVVASTFDELPENHMRVADMVMEKAKRLVEMKQDVVILLDSITRLSRASNLVVTPSGRTLSGGLDPAAMYRPKRMFGAARNIEEGGSLTILATTLVDTGSRMDDMIFEEFKGTGNMDLVLDRDLFNQRIFPAIDINKSGTRRDDLLMSKEDLASTFHLRRTLAALDNDKAVTLLIDRLKNTKTNHDFIQIVQKSRQTGGTAAQQS